MQFTIARRITAGFALLILLLLALAWVATQALRRTSRAYESELDTQRTVVDVGLRAAYASRGADIVYLRYLTDPEERDLVIRDSLAELALTEIQQLRDSAPTGERRTLWEDVLAARERRQREQNAALASARAGRAGEAANINRARVTPAREAYEAAFNRALGAAEASVDAALADDARTRRAARLALLWGSIFATVVAVVAAAVIARSITRPLRNAATLLGTSAAEILATTSEQAAGAQQTSTAVAEVVATVEEVARTADQATGRAKLVADSSRELAAAGVSGRKAVGESVSGVTQVREQVEASARSILALAEQAQSISEITANVNDIAEQTNILALNAGVEAARVGEQGRGFAVVASEIKILADQSKKATVQVRQILGEIQRAIGAAVMSTEQGTKQAAGVTRQISEVGTQIGALADGVVRAEQLGAQIVASAGQQAAGMAQIREAMSGINQATQQHFTATEQAKRAAADLNALGTELLALVGANGRSTRGARARR
jgi:methyl-accepting chemotaxis protein